MDEDGRGQHRAPDDAAAGGRQPPLPCPSATFSIQPPEPFTFTKPQEWERWISRFERFRQASNLHTYPQANQIYHVPGKSLWTADTLSRAPLRDNAASADDELMESTNIYVDSIMGHLPASASYLNSLREHLKADSVCSSVMRTCQDGWPEFSCCSGPEKLHWGERAFLTVHDRLLLNDLPERPWQKPGTDLFTLKGKTYRLVVDYYSRYIEVANLSLTRSTDITGHLKSIFVRHGIPETLVSDNGPQFAASTFSDLAAAYGFKHVTSNPSNREAERAVQMVKNLLTKAPDPYLALLVYRTTPLQNGCSPAQLLMGRQLRTTVPILPSLLDPSRPESDAVSSREREKRGADQMCYNKRHRAHDLG
ncbi:hypothetical protein SKAU_G00350790 [Synaphobranchus kaupii]|uniref:Integrase catalytic domain-containing protein n=1 Tax=Synaphobranchus kaupii TaxID=118154 RepID=A0A9Q1EKF4_SYNKA|nr:hypothetical protein SKAU_G00350790 [Synaphobranchus kaupii]